MHSADLIGAFDAFFRRPRSGEVYNVGGDRFSNCSMLEAIAISQKVVGRELNWTYTDDNRTGDHIGWISDLIRFQNHYRYWSMQYDVPRILAEIADSGRERWVR